MTDIVERLIRWRNADHEDNIVLSRNDVCDLLDKIERMQNALENVNEGLPTAEDVRGILKP